MKNRIIASALVAAMLVSMTACANTNSADSAGNGGAANTEATGVANTDGGESAYQTMVSMNDMEENVIDDNYRNYYQIFPYSFCDSNGDGVGDINGITSKLDYIKDMGADGLWITPVSQSPSYHKYDVVDYCSIDEQFGTLEDYENMIKECDARDINVLFDLVVNHTSSEHPWFKEAYSYIQSLGEGEEPNPEDCPYVEYYNFSKERESGWSVVEGTDWYYESQFVYSMPDLNLDNENVRAEIDKIIKFWLDEGVSGFRLDATTSYYTGRDDMNIDFMSWLNDVVKGYDPDAYIVGECWTDASTYTNYYKSGVDSFFDFDFATKSGTIVKTLTTGSALNFGKKLVSVDEKLKANNPDYIDAAFTSNHDTARIAGSFAGDSSEAQVKMAQGLAMMMGGAYYLYYGEELGMKGSGDDENKRTPMLWSNDENAEGMCKSIATKDIDMKYGTLEDQQDDESSIYNFVKQGIKLRNVYPEIARGENSVEEGLSDEAVLVLKKDYDGSVIYVVINTKQDDKTVDVSSLGELSMGGELITGDTIATLDAGTLDMPGYSIVILK